MIINSEIDEKIAHYSLKQPEELNFNAH